MAAVKPIIGLVLSGGGARAAYQVGALRALSEILAGSASPFQILAGLSAGAINSAAIAAHADDFPRAVQHLHDTWMALQPDNVYRTDVSQLAKLGVRWFRDLTTGGALGSKRASYLLDTEPMRELISRKIELWRMEDHFASGRLRGHAVSATNYLTGTTVTFFDGIPELQPWARYDRVGIRERLTTEHLMASSAIPVFFPPVSIDGRAFGDGGIRMSTPFSPAIHLGADKVIAVGVRYVRTREETAALNRASHSADASLAQIGGVLLNAVFLDSLDNDYLRMQRINRTLAFIPAGARRDDQDALRPIPAMLLQPSQDLGHLAANEYAKFPVMFRHLLRGIGATNDSGWDLLSYLAFQPGYVSKLIELGYADTMARRRELEVFFELDVSAS